MEYCKYCPDLYLNIQIHSSQFWFIIELNKAKHCTNVPATWKATTIVRRCVFWYHMNFEQFANLSWLSYRFFAPLFKYILFYLLFCIKCHLVSFVFRLFISFLCVCVSFDWDLLFNGDQLRWTVSWFQGNVWRKSWPDFGSSFVRNPRWESLSPSDKLYSSQLWGVLYQARSDFSPRLFTTRSSRHELERICPFCARAGVQPWTLHDDSFLRERP